MLSTCSKCPVEIIHEDNEKYCDDLFADLDGTEVDNLEVLENLKLKKNSSNNKDTN